MPTRARWDATWRALGCLPPAGGGLGLRRSEAPSRDDASPLEREARSVASYEDVMRCYGEPHRAYHTSQHLGECFARLDRVRHLASRPPEVELGLWLHDVVYDTRASDSEARSASIARAMLARGGAAAPVGARVAELILATRHTAVPTDDDAMLLVDIDLSILGAAPVRFYEYEAQVRKEYDFVPEPQFRVARRGVLEAFLARPWIYGTAHFREAKEARARANLRASLARLTELA
jgi:predicted metal-dependent HD superfamily phosphohydrolase